MKHFRFLFIVLLYALVACTQEADKSPDGRIAAKVNGSEITRRQVDYIFNRTSNPGLSEEAIANQKRRILSDLVRVELFAAKAREMGIDKDPEYLMALYSAQKTVLAGFAEEKLSKDMIKPPSEQEVDDVIQNNPFIFSGRKIYFYDEVLIPGVDMQLLDMLAVNVKNGATMDQLLMELKDRKIQYSQTLKSLTSENVPATILSILNRLQVSRPQLINAGNKVSIILCLRYSASIPIEGDAARKTARDMISQRQRVQSLSKNMTEMFNNAKITYFDEYALKETGNRKLVTLPVPDVKKVERKTNRIHLVGAVVAFQYILVLLSVTAVMRSLFSKLWLPRLWSEIDLSEEERGAAHTRYQPTVNIRIYLYASIVLIVGLLGFELHSLLGKMPVWVLFAYIIGGLLTGIPVSRIYSLPVFRKSSRKVYLFVLAFLGLIIYLVSMIVARLSLFLGIM